MKQSLTRAEKRYLDLLLEHEGGVQTEDFLGEEPARSGRNLVAAHMVTLRRKVAGKYKIEAVHGWGYQLFKV